MAIDHERYLVSKILKDRDTASIGDAGIQPHHFHDPDARRVFEAILSLKGEYGVNPTPAMLKEHFPTYKFVNVEEPIDYLINYLQHRHALGMLEEALGEAVDLWKEEKVDDIRTVLADVLTATARDTQRTRDTNIAETVPERLERYEALKHRESDLLGYTSGFNFIDRATSGYQDKQLIFYVGPPKAGKSTMMLLSAMRIWQAGYRPLLIGFEMTNEEQEERLDAIWAGVSHRDLRTGNLTGDDWRELKRSMHSMESMSDFFLSNDTMSTTTLSGVEAKIEQYDPDVVFIDGVYMMDDENGEKKGSSQALTNVTRGLKRLGQNNDLPVIATSQVLESKMDAKRGVTSNSVGYSSSFAQDGDALIAVENTDDPDIKKLKILLARNTGAEEMYVNWDWSKSKFEEMDHDPFADPEAEDYGVSF